MLPCLQVTQQIKQSLRIGGTQFLLAHLVGGGVVLAVGAIVAQRGEVGALVGLGIRTFFQEQVDILVPSGLAGLGVVEHRLKQLQCLRHGTVETREVNVDGIIIHIHSVTASQVVEHLIDLLVGELRCSHIIKITGRYVVAVVTLLTKRIVVGQREEVVIGILLVEHVDTLLRDGLGEVFFVINETGLDGLRLNVDHLLEEVTLLVIVGRYRRDAGLLDLVDRRVIALTLEDGHIVVEEEAVGKIYDLLARHLGDAVETGDLVAPLLPVDESIHKLVCARAVALQRAVIAQFHVVDHCGKEVVGKLSLLQLLYLGEHQLAHLLQALALLGASHQDELPIIGHAHAAGPCTLNLHRRVEVQVEQASLAIGEHVGDDIERVSLVAGRALRLPSHHQVLGLKAHHRGVHGGSQLTHLSILGTAEVVTLLPVAEILVDDGHHLVGVEIARHADSHVVGHIVTVEVILDVDYGRVLQMVLRSDGRLCAIGMVGEELGAQRIPFLIVVAGQSDVVLLIDSLQLGVESADNHVLEAVTLYLSPCVNLIGRDVLHITGDIIGSVSVATLRANGRHELVILIGDVILGCEL